MNSNPPPHRPRAFFKSIPKVELHRHLEGSLRLSTMIEVAKEQGLNLPVANAIDMKALVQISPDDPLTFENFLSKFTTLRLFYRSPEIIGRITREAVADAAQDNVRYLELRFTPVALSNAEGFPLPEVMDWVATSAQEAARDHGITTRLIASVNRHESPELAEKVAYHAAERLSAGIVGLDLAGNEAEFSAKPFAGIFNEARQAGLQITVHAGEWGSAENIIDAIQVLKTRRIGHGVRVLENETAVALAREQGTVFEVCPTSNYQSGVTPSLERHPLPKMLAAGLKVTLNTDDPGVSNIELTNEYELACETLQLSLDDLRSTVVTAAQASFLPPGESEHLAESVSSAFPVDD